MVLGGESCTRGGEIEFHCYSLDSTFVVKIILTFENTKKHEQDARDGPFF